MERSGLLFLVDDTWDRRFGQVRQEARTSSRENSGFKWKDECRCKLVGWLDSWTMSWTKYQLIKFQTGPPPMTSDRLRPCLSPCPQVHALGSHLFQGLAPSSACQSNLQQCGVPRVTSIYQENKRRTTVERYNSPFSIALLKRSISLDFQGIRANTLISIIFPSR